MFACSTVCSASASGVITGNVKFEGNPVERALVQITSPDKTQKTGLTDGEGYYSISNLSAGTYFVTVVHPLYIVDAGESAIGGAHQLVEIKDDSRLTLNFSLTKGGVITGVAYDSSGQPVVDQQVYYERVDSADTSFSIMSFRPEVLTNAQGEFRIYGLPAGRYRVAIGRATNREVGKLVTPFRVTYYPGVEEEAQAEIINLAAGRESNLGRLVVKAAQRTFQAEVRALDQETGALLIDFSFDILTVTAGEVNSRTTLKTGVDGRAKIKNLKPGRYLLLPAVANGGVETGDFPSVSFNILDKDVSDIVIQRTSATAYVSGEVKIENVFPASEMDCTLALKEGEDLAARDKPTYHVKLNAEGKFRIRGLRQTVYTLVILPLKPSLHYESAQLDGQLFRNPNIFGALRLDVQAGGTSVIINLNRTDR